MQCVPFADCSVVEPQARLNAVLAEVEQDSLGCLEKIVDVLRGDNRAGIDLDMRDRLDNLKDSVAKVIAQSLAAQMVVALRAELEG